MYYAIRVQGHLGQSWQDRFGGLCIEQQQAGTTLLSGTLPDQAALHGVLLQIIRLGLTLLSLETSEGRTRQGMISDRSSRECRSFSGCVSTGREWSSRIHAESRSQISRDGSSEE